jgi:hypothetical protein
MSLFRMRRGDNKIVNTRFLATMPPRRFACPKSDGNAANSPKQRVWVSLAVNKQVSA